MRLMVDAQRLGECCDTLESTIGQPDGSQQNSNGAILHTGV